MQDEVSALEQTIYNELVEQLAIPEAQLYRMFLTSDSAEDMAAVTKIKAAGIRLTDNGKCSMMTDSKGGFVILINNKTEH